MRQALTREFYIPAGSRAVRDRHSDAVAYLYESKSGLLYAMAFGGRRQKPDFHFRFRDQAKREAAIREHFEKCRQQQNRRTENRTKPRKLQVGHILKSSWGYDQTNVDFYQVTGLIGSTMVELRKVAAVSKETASMQGTCVPDVDTFTGDPIRRRADGDGVRIDDVRWASLWNARPASWTAYH